MATVRVQAEPFDSGAELARLLAGRTDIGGIGAFIGVVRGSTGSDPLASLTLEHFSAMTEKALARIASEAECRWDLLGCTVIHRYGRLRPGEPIVLVLAASAHREPALAATSFLIDWLKTRAPFWKKEERPDGTAYWVEARASDDEAAARWERDGT
ncbi:MAG: molybdenum cofactor biosynthesis protein MoaE [Acetobacteraceae bacterium]|nr:molybdenum cofactor biosynthesis protein MoaE [Acetobacteraceae bacterium]